MSKQNRTPMYGTEMLCEVQTNLGVVVLWIEDPRNKDGWQDIGFTPKQARELADRIIACANAIEKNASTKER